MNYMRRWLTILIVIPAMFVLVPMVDRILGGERWGFGLWGAVSTDFLNMVGFYGGYVFVAATVGSVLHTWLVQRLRLTSPASVVLCGAAIGLLVLVPQAIVFGRGYWLANGISGAFAGCVYGYLVSRSLMALKSTA